MARRVARRRRPDHQSGISYFVCRFNRDEPVTYATLEEHFKYGSTGGERESGIPYWIWKVLPKMFPEYLPGKTYVPGPSICSLGFLYEPGKDLPIGVSTPQHAGNRSRLSELRHLPCRFRARNRAEPARHLHRHAVEHGRSRSVRAFYFCLRVRSTFQRRRASCARWKRSARNTI